MAQEGHLAGHGHLGLVQPELRCLWHRRNLSGESARNAAPNSSLKLLRVLLQVKLSSSLVNSVHQQQRRQSSQL